VIRMSNFGFCFGCGVVGRADDGSLPGALSTDSLSLPGNGVSPCLADSKS